MTTRNADEGLTIAAYTALKAEQSSRISVRDNYGLTYAASLATLFFGYYTTKNSVILLVVSPVSFIGLHAYATNDQRISAIRAFLRHNLPTSIARDWEAGHHEASRIINVRSILRLIVSLLLFAGPAIVSSAIVFDIHSSDAVQLASSLTTCGSLVLMIVTYIALYASTRIPG
jgi:hypothetical protein